LQVAVIEQRNLHGRIGRERPLEQPPNHGVGRFGVVGRAQRHHVLAEFGPGDVLHRTHATVGRKPGAPREQNGKAGQHRRERPRRQMWHRPPHGLGDGAMRSFWSCHGDGSTGRRLT
jgi:hypothetical protein